MTLGRIEKKLKRLLPFLILYFLPALPLYLDNEVPQPADTKCTVILGSAAEIKHCIEERMKSES